MHIEFTAKVKESDEVYDTTYEDVAKEHDIYNPNQDYSPVLVAVGKNWMVEGLEEQLVGREEGDSFTAEIPPEDGYGERDPDKIELYTRRKLLEAGIKEDLQPGMIVEVDGLPATVRTYSGGRALLDFNPPLAGKTLIHDVKVTRVNETRDSKIEALVDRRFPELAQRDDFYEYREDDVLEVYIDEDEMAKENLQVIKRGISNDVFEFIPETGKVRFVEELVNPAPPEAEEEDKEEEEEKAEEQVEEGEE